MPGCIPGRPGVVLFDAHGLRARHPSALRIPCRVGAEHMAVPTIEEDDDGVLRSGFAREVPCAAVYAGRCEKCYPATPT